ncbi:MAG TPA: hypothetical protein VF510_25730 [Ktedonobacterales bacterium]
MATFQIAGTSLDNDGNSLTAPLVVLFERDDAIAVPLLSQLRMAGYDVRSARTPVELFDILGKHLVALVLVDLGVATAGRREFWVALDAQRRGRAIQVMTFRYTPPGGLYDMDFDQTARAIADVEVHGAHEFQVVIDAVRQRIPLHGGANPLLSPGGSGMMGGMNVLGAMSMPNAALSGGIAPIGAALGVPSPFMQPGMMGFGGQTVPFGAPNGIPNSPSMPPQMPYDPSGAGGAYNPYTPYGANGAYGAYGPPSMPLEQQMEMGATYGPMFQQSPGAPQMPPGFGVGPNGAPMAYPQMPYPQASPTPSFGQGGQAPQPNVYGFTAGPSTPAASGYEAASPFAHPVGANPFSAEIEASPFAQPYNMNPFASEAPASTPAGAPDFDMSQMAPPPAMQPSPFAAAAASPPPFAAPFIAPEPVGNGQRFDVGDFEQRAAQLSAAYAAQFDIQTPPPGMSPSQPGRSYPGFSSSFGGSNHQNGYGGPRTPEPISDVWTPPDADMNDLLEGATGVVPEMAFKPITPAASQPDATTHPTAPWPSLTGEAAETPAVHDTPAPAAAPAEGDASFQQEQATSRLPAPPHGTGVYRASPTEKALSTVLVEGALLDEGKMETLQGIQQMLASVDMSFKLGELALLFKFLSPDQLLAAVLVSRGLVTPAQIAGLGRAKQDLASSGMDYDLETLISMFNILPPEQLRELRNELASRH